MCSQCRISKLWISLSVHLVYRTEAYSKIPGASIWHHRQQGTTGCKLLELVEQCQPDYLAQNVSFNNERSRFCPDNLRSSRCLPYELFKVLAARKIYLITARACKNKRTARMLVSARKDDSIPLHPAEKIWLWRQRTSERTSVRTSVQTLGEGEGRLEIFPTVTHTGN